LVPIGIPLIALLILPAAFIRVFTLRSIALTLEAYDPYTRWYDRHPRAVLSVGIWCGVAALMLLAWIPWGVERCFSVFIDGWAATAMTAGWAVVFATASVLCLRGSRAGWWVALVGCGLYLASGLITDIKYDFASKAIDNHVIVLTGGLIAAVWYLVQVWKHFDLPEHACKMR
jgi:hypothetical protein